MQQFAGFLPVFIILGAFMFFGARRQRKAMQATIDLQESLRVGDLVNTVSGMQGTIAAIGDDTVDLQIAPGVVTRWNKMAVQGRIEPEAPVYDPSAVATELTRTDADHLPKD